MGDLFLKSKSDTFSSFFFWFNRIRNQFNTRINIIRSDNGVEFNNQKFKQFCHNYGILQQFTVPYNPQSNGRAERFNGTFINSAKVMLNDAKLIRQLCEDAVATTNYFHNMLLHKGISNKIPFEIIFKSKVNYINLRVFGCKVFFYVPKSFRNKFDNNILPGIFLEYSNNPYTYKILDITNNKIVLSRSVDFFENTPGNNYLTHCHLIPFNFITNHEIRGNNTYFQNNIYTSNTIQENQNQININKSNLNHFNEYLSNNENYNEIFKLNNNLINYGEAITSNKQKRKYKKKNKTTQNNHNNNNNNSNINNNYNSNNNNYNSNNNNNNNNSNNNNNDQ